MIQLCIASDRQLVEGEDLLGEPESMEVLGLVFDNVELPQFKTPCTGCKIAKCRFLHQARVNKFSVEEITTRPAKCKEEYKSKKERF